MSQPAIRPRLAIVLLSVVLIHCGSKGPAEPGENYPEEIARFRAEREDRLREPTGWLSVIGLHWLQEGENRFGSDPGNEIVLPADASPPFAGTLAYDDGKARVRPQQGVDLLVNDEPLTGERTLSDDAQAKPDLVTLGRLEFHVIARGERHGLRVKDPESAARRQFGGLAYFPVEPSYRVEARLRPYDAPETREVATVTGDPTEMIAPGVLEFEIDGRRLSLEPYVSKPDSGSLFIIFKDRTSGHETYGAGRFLSATLENGKAILDFNRAYNPPCAFTAFATCPLPPAANRLDVEVRAGEKAYHAHHATDDPTSAI